MFTFYSRFILTLEKTTTMTAGFDDFLARRGEVKSKDLSGGAMANLSLCGLD